MARRWIMELDALDGANNPVVLRYSTHQHDSDEPFEVRLKQPALFRVRATGSLIGEAQSGIGEAVLINTDGGLDYLADYAVDGRTCTITLVSDDEVFPESEAWSYLDTSGSSDLLDVDGAGSHLIVDQNSFQAYIGIVQSLQWRGNDVIVKLRDGREQLEDIHPHTVYLGNNVLPNGVEGVADDIKGNFKPVVYGAAVNVKPVLVNTSQYIYQIHEGAGFVVGAVYDQGVLLTEAAGQPETSLANLYASTPAAGEYTWFDGYVKVGAVPLELTISGGDGSGGNSAGDTFAQIANEAGYQVDAADVAAMNALGKGRLYMDREMRTVDMLDAFAKSFGCYWVVRKDGTIRVRQLDEPAASPSIEITDAEIIKISRSTVGSGENGVPLWRCVWSCDPVEFVQSTFAAAAHPAVRSRMSNKFRRAVSEDAATKTRHLLADELHVESVVRFISEAQGISDHILNLMKVRRDRVVINARLTVPVLQSLDVGVSVRVVSSKFDYDAGRNFLVMGYEINARTDSATLELWG